MVHEENEKELDDISPIRVDVSIFLVYMTIAVLHTSVSDFG